MGTEKKHGRGLNKGNGRGGTQEPGQTTLKEKDVQRIQRRRHSLLRKKFLILARRRDLLRKSSSGRSSGERSTVRKIYLRAKEDARVSSKVLDLNSHYAS